MQLPGIVFCVEGSYCRCPRSFVLCAALDLYACCLPLAFSAHISTKKNASHARASSLQTALGRIRSHARISIDCHTVRAWCSPSLHGQANKGKNEVNKQTSIPDFKIQVHPWYTLWNGAYILNKQPRLLLHGIHVLGIHPLITVARNQFGPLPGVLTKNDLLTHLQQ